MAFMTTSFKNKNRSIRSTQSFSIFYWILIGFLALSGCASPNNSSDDSDTIISINGNRATSTDSDLVLLIPEDVDIADGYSIAAIFQIVDTFSGCKADEALDLVLAQACAFFQQYYLFPEQLPTSLDGFINIESYVNQLQKTDPYSVYLPPQQYSEIISSLEGESAKIGFGYELLAETVSSANPLRVTRIIPLSRAWFDGLQVGDQITAINGNSLEGLNLETILGMLPNMESEQTALTIKRAGEEQTIQTAAEEHIAFLLGDNKDIAYLRATQYTLQTGKRIREDFESLQGQSTGTIKKLVLDLRNNGGGSVTAALELVDYLIDNDTPPQTNPILITDGTIFKNQTDYLGEYSDFNVGNFAKDNFVVLINGNSASATEITVAALKDYDTATIIGEQSFGKGISQNAIDLIDGSGIFVPSHYLLPPSGEAYHSVGIEPHYTVSANPTSVTNDPQLEAAIGFLRTGIVTAYSQSFSQLFLTSLSRQTDPWVQQYQYKLQ
ncbi:MAG: PDZ domain-containing protein [SAR324 cluster bacterium]|nr:PDZ domain-containing protein [SAR324 cluster bacterium]